MNLWEMQVIKYLSSVEKKGKRLQFLQSEKDELEHRIYGIGSPGSGEKVQSSPAHDQIEKNQIRLEEKRAELATAVDVYTDFRLQVTEQISRIESDKHAEVLFRRYMKYQKLQDIAEDMNYTYSYTTKIHREAINKFRRVNPELMEKLKKQLNCN